MNKIVKTRKDAPFLYFLICQLMFTLLFCIQSQVLFFGITLFSLFYVLAVSILVLVLISLSLFTLLKPAKYPGSTILVQCCQGKFIQQ